MPKSKTSSKKVAVSMKDYIPQPKPKTIKKKLPIKIGKKYYC